MRTRDSDAADTTAKAGAAKASTAAIWPLVLLFALGTALALYVIYLSRSGPDPDAAKTAPAPPGPDPVEAELQEIIADEMARQLLRDLDLGQQAVNQPEVRDAVSSQQRA